VVSAKLASYATLFAAGALFAAGLALSGLTNANKVLGFLDVSGGWDPSLALVMGGALAVNAPVVWWSRRANGPLFATGFPAAVRQDITPRLVIGAAIFGAGWGLGGYCPGPGLVSLASLAAAPALFVAAMSIGWAVTAAIETSVDPGWSGRVDPVERDSRDMGQRAGS
jgi:uncharacterized membrane protein YedE/YeeE